MRKVKINYYPIALNLQKKRTLVVGGGNVAEHKIKLLLRSKAKVRLISPKATRWLEHLSKRRKIDWIARDVRQQDIKKTGLVIAATNNEQVNKRISRWAKKENIPVNLVDQSALSTFISPALLYAPQATIAVYTNGRDPVLSRDLKNFLKEHWDVFLSYRNRL